MKMENFLLTKNVNVDITNDERISVKLGSTSENRSNKNVN